MEQVVNELVNLSPAPDIIVLQCLDNSAFFVQNEDGTLTLPVKSRVDNKHHVLGQLKLANKEQVGNVMKLLKPFLTCIKEAKVKLLTCLPRYLHDPCCVDPGHMVDKDKSNQAADLTLLKKAVRSFIFAEKLKGVRVVDPTMLCITTEKSCWEDPVHLNKEQFAKLADGLAGMIAGVEEPAAEGEGGADKPDAKQICLLSSPLWS